MNTDQDLQKLIEQAKSIGWTEGYIAGLEYARKMIEQRSINAQIEAQRGSAHADR